MQARKRYGQHFLQPAWADRLTQAIAPRANQDFLEIGPGSGALTLRLAPRVGHLTAVEIDRELIAELTPLLPPNVTLIQQDFLDFDLAAVTGAGPVRIAGNLPYNVSSPILFKLLRTHRGGGRLIDATLMLQREVADRLQASPGSRDYGILAILTQLHADVRPLLTLPPGAFRPAPKVHSSVVGLTFRAPSVRLTDEPLFEAMVRSMFTQRRKMLGNALSRFGDERGLPSSTALSRAGIDPRRRPETLQLEELARLAETFVAS
jgi:16S rRNA (adenine1518-N6/adenine1519-N6)-dimethyltransferase